jgi:long-subunit fatty acid transport protein
VAYDSNPVDSKDRNAQLPVDRQIRVAGGARYQLNDSIVVGGYLTYMDMGDARIKSSSFGGDFKNNEMVQLAVNATWRF